jgi:hypothetical protein
MDEVIKFEDLTVEQVMELTGVDRQMAAFILDIERGVCPGDVVKLP